MSNFFKDIIIDYESGLKEAYYTRDFWKGIKLLGQIYGLGKFMIAIGKITGGALGGLFSWASRNPSEASRYARIIAQHGNEIEKLFTSIGDYANSKYNSMSYSKKKSVRTAVLIIARKVKWNQLI